MQQSEGIWAVEPLGYPINTETPVMSSITPNCRLPKTAALVYDFSSPALMLSGPLEQLLIVLAKRVRAAGFLTPLLRVQH
jgi:hypothetical protein